MVVGKRLMAIRRNTLCSGHVCRANMYVNMSEYYVDLVLWACAMLGSLVGCVCVLSLVACV